MCIKACRNFLPVLLAVEKYFLPRKNISSPNIVKMHWNRADWASFRAYSPVFGPILLYFGPKWSVLQVFCVQFVCRVLASVEKYFILLQEKYFSWGLEKEYYSVETFLVIVPRSSVKVANVGQYWVFSYYLDGPEGLLPLRGAYLDAISLSNRALRALVEVTFS